MPDRDATNQAPRILSLWQGSWIAALAVGVVVWGLILWPVIAFRRKRDATGLPPQTRYNLPIEILYTVVPFIMIAVFFYFTARDEDQHHARSRRNPDHDDHGRRASSGAGSSTTPATAARRHDVTGTPGKPPDARTCPRARGCSSTCSSPDVIHSFWVPAFLFKMDVIPGRTNKFEITPTKLGTYAAGAPSCAASGPRPDAVQRQGRPADGVRPVRQSTSRSDVAQGSAQ